MPANIILDEEDLMNTSQPFDYDHFAQWRPPIIINTTSIPIPPDDNDTITDDENDTITDDENDTKNEPEPDPEIEPENESKYKYEWDPYPVDHPEVIPFYQDVESVLFRSLQRQAIKYTFNPESKLTPLPSTVCPKFEDFGVPKTFNAIMKYQRIAENQWGDKLPQFNYNTNLSNDRCDIDAILESGKKRKQRKKYHSSSKRSSKHYKSSSSSSSSKYRKSSSSSTRKISSKSTSKTSSSSSQSKSISNKHKTSKSPSSSSSGSKRGDIKTKTSSSSSSKQRVSTSSSSNKKIRTESKSSSSSKSKSTSNSKSSSKSKGKAILEVKHALTGTVMNYNNGFNGYNGYNYNYNYLVNMNMNNGYGACYDNYGNYVDYQANYDYSQYYQPQCFNNNNHYGQYYPNYNNQDIDHMAYFPINMNKLPDIAENTNTNDSSSVPSHFSYSNSRNDALNL